MKDHVFRLLMTQTWQITALAIVVAVVIKLAAKNRPHLAHALWMLVLIKCVTPPLWGHSLGVFSQLQVRLMPDPEQGQLDRYAPDELYSMADTESPADASLMRDGGTDMEQGQSQSLSIDEGTVPTLDVQEAGIAYAVPVLPAESVASDATWLRPGGLLLSGLAAGAILTLCLLVFRYLRCLREIHRHRTMEFDEPLRERVQHLSRQLRVRRIPQIIVSDVLFGPAVLGLLRHTIVLPRCLFEKMASDGLNAVPSPPGSGEKVADRPDEGADRESSTFNDQLSFLDPILAHELLHIRRGDLRTGTLQAIVQSLWWFHPAVWLSNRWLSREAERCCDEQVIAEFGCSPAQYARSLLSVIECKHRLQPIPVFPGMKPVEITIQRMERIMALKNGLNKRTPIWCWLTVVALAIVVLPGAVIQPAVDEVKPEVLLKIADRVNTPLTASVRLDDNFVLSQDVPVTGSTVIAYVNKKPITVESLLAESSTALLLKHLPEMTDSDRRRIVTNAIEKSLPPYVYQEVVLQHFDADLSAEQQAQLAVAQEKRDAELVAMLPGMLEQSMKLESQEDLLATAYQKYVIRDQAANGDLSRLSRDARVARYIEVAPATDVVCERDTTLRHCRELLLQARLRNDVSLRFSNTSLTDVMRSIATDYGINIAVKTRVVEKSATVTFHCDNEPLDEALNTILEPFGFRVRLHDEVVMIESADSEQTLSKGATADAETTTKAKAKDQTVVESLESASVRVYPVADLVVLQQPVIAAVSRSSENENQATRAVVPASAEAVASEKTADKSEPVPHSETQKPAPATNYKADFAPLTELIKATVHPESWEKGLAIQVEEKTLSLIIRQSEEAHEEIQELLSQLRDAQDQSVQIPCLVVHLTTESQTKWLEEQCSLHPLQHGSRWALLPPQRCESFTQALLEQKPEVLSRPVVRTISGQIATITVGALAAGGAATAVTGIRLEVTPHVLPYSNVIRLQHSFSVGKFTDEMPMPVESLVGSGQTLLLLVDDPAEKEKSDAARFPCLLMLTPEYIPQKEEDEAASGATPENSADAVD